MKKIILGLLLMGLITTSAEKPPPLELSSRSNLGSGFFAELGNVVNMIKGLEPYNLKKVTVDWTQEFFPYKNGALENGWDLFFEPIVCDAEEKEVPSPIFLHHHFIHDQQCIAHWMAYKEHLPYRQAVNRILTKYVKIKQPILDELESIYQQQLAGHYCIGAHVRWAVGANGVSCEAPKGMPTLQSYIDEIKGLMARTETSLPFKIFLATDSNEVIHYFKQHFSDDILFYLPNAHRSAHQEQSHLIFENTSYWQSHPWEFHQRKPGYRGGVEALLDVLLLSKCEVYIHSTSNVAAFVSYFAPEIESIFVPKDNRTWPCRYGL